MSCSCNGAKKEKVAHGLHSSENASAMTVSIRVRADNNPLACERCLDKHLAKALVYACEAVEENERHVERVLARENLSCAAEHAEALGDERAEKIAKRADFRMTMLDPSAIRALLLGSGDDYELAVGRLGVAEDALRFIGRNDLADRVRSVRLELMEKTLESQQGAGVENAGVKSSPVVEKAGTPA